MRPFDFLGLKNFRVFDDKNGFFEELSSINILTGANNSGKSTLIKSFQMLKNSIKENQFPFDLDLTEQEHLLGDFENLLFNKKKREVEISLPFTFLGIRKIYINLQFSIPSSQGAYKGHLRSINVIDQSDSTVLFSFSYREATDEEKQIAEIQFKQELEDFEKKKNEPSEEDESVFSASGYLFRPFENPLIGYVEWSIQAERLKSYLIQLKKFYDSYLTNGKKWKPLEEIDEIVAESGLVPSLLIKSLKQNIPIESWDDFICNKLGSNTKLTGREHIGERDFEPDDFFFPVPEIEQILYSETLKILKSNLKWTSPEEDDTTFSVIENCFQTSWQVLINRISTINYVSTTKEENLRIYNATSNSPFIKLLRSYSNAGNDSKFVKKYLRAFEIGKNLKVNYEPKYQLMSVLITGLDGQEMELVDFGYGIKQVIVYLIQISVLAEKNKRIEHGYNEDGEYMTDVYDPSLLLIEEPESNLHPKWQSLIAKMLMEASKDFNIQLVIETHSEYLIRKFQTLVADGQLPGSNVNIFYLRNAKQVNDGRQVERITIQDDGSINYKAFDSGFFDESEKLELGLLNIQRDKFWKDFEALKNSQLDSENKIVELEQKIDEFTNKSDVTVYAQIILLRFSIAKLSPVSVQYLVSGQFLLANINDLGDFSPVIIQYGRAIENELKQIFNIITAGKNWMLGVMQGSLEKFKFDTATAAPCSNLEYAQLPTVLTDMFNVPTNLRIDLINDLRETRNSAGHAGLTKTKQEAIDYINTANEFLDSWIAEKK